MFYPSSQPRIFTARFVKLVNDHDDTTLDQSVQVTDTIVVPANFFGWKRLCDPADPDYNAADITKTFAADDAVQQGTLIGSKSR